MIPIIVTSRLTLSLVRLSDLQAVHALNSLPETDRYNTLGIPESIDVTIGILNTLILDSECDPVKSYTFVIKDSQDGRFIGLFGLRFSRPKYRAAEVWYNITFDEWSQGYATEALKGVIDFGFNTLNLHRIESGCAVENVGSIRVMEKSGMIHEGMRRQVLPLKTGWADNYMYAILAEDYLFNRY